MFLVDTHVVSELRKARGGKADRNVLRWAHAVAASTLYLSVVTILELEMGVRQIEARDQRQGAMLRRWLDGQVLTTFDGRILPVDTAVARLCARLHVPDRRPERDALIAATGLAHGLTVVTRNTTDFAGTGVPLLDPWLSSPAP